MYWLTKETLQTFFANGSNRNIFYTEISELSQRCCLQKVLFWFMTDALCDDVILL